MNNPISRMPNPMAPMGQVPQIPPMGANPTAQNPSAMPLPVVNQPSVDMQMMGTTANQRKKFNDMMESLSAPRQPVEKPVQNMFYGGMAGYGMPMMPMMNPYMGMGMGYGGMGYGGMGIGNMGMNPYSMAYPSYSPGFGMNETTSTTPTDTSQSPFGNTITPTVAPSYGNMDSGTFPDTTGYTPRIPDIFMPDKYKPAVLDPPVEAPDPTTMPITTMPIEPRPKLPWEQSPGKLAPIVDGEIKAWNSDWGEQPRDPRDVFDYDDPIMTTMANGGQVQYLKGGGSTMPSGKYSYSKDLDDKIAKLIGGAITTPEEERFKSPPMMGMAERPAMYGMGKPSMYGMAAPVNPYNKNIGYNVEQGLPKNDPLLTQGQNVKVGMRSGQNVLQNDPVQDTSFMAGQRGKLDEMRAENRSPDYYDALRGRMYNQKPPILDVPILPMQSGPDIGPIMPARDLSTGIESITQSQSIPDVLKDLGEYIIDKIGIGSFANGGPVQYLRGGGPTNPISKTKIVPFVEKEKDYNLDKTIPNFFTKTLPNVVSSVKDFLDTPVVELFTGPGAGPDINQSIKKISGPQGPAGLLPQANVDTTQQVNFDDPSPIKSGPDYSSLPINYTGNFTQPKAYDSEEQLAKPLINMIMENAQNPTMDPIDIIDVNKLGTDVLDMKAPMDVAPPLPPKRGGAGFFVNPSIPDPYNIGELGEFDTSINQSGQTPSEVGGIGLGSGIGSFDDGIDYTNMRKYDVPISSDSAAPPTAFLPPARPDNIGKIDSTVNRANVIPGSGADFDPNFTLPGEEGARDKEGRDINQIGGYNNRTGWMDQISRGNTIDPVSGYPYSIMISASRVNMTPEEYSNLSFGEKADLFSKEMEVQRADMAYGLRKHATALKNFDFTAPVDNYGAMSQGREGSTYRGPINTGGGNFFQEMIDKIIPPSEDAEEVPTPTPTATGGYVCPDGWLYDANTSSCVKQGKGFGGQGMNMGGAVSPSLNNAVDNFLQALA